jgi:hypothetical protein
MSILPAILSFDYHVRVITAEELEALVFRISKFSTTTNDSRMLRCSVFRLEFGSQPVISALYYSVYTRSEEYIVVVSSDQRLLLQTRPCGLHLAITSQSHRESTLRRWKSATSIVRYFTSLLTSPQSYRLPGAVISRKTLRSGCKTIRRRSLFSRTYTSHPLWPV